ncbi:MAG: DUF2256 domain-containing protein [Betaproteobacteria bacterium]|nr:DUF2256 domain-containing protein [Pseudomonadota bacterium]NBO12937.1 DUF2256 domain-containing protein [Betaproteobacteria bacterium]NBO44816.1 DUF2256 domain-containing protein [Betaproteobacteria bacterium]NBP10780.1 DUF2256 domain-containing protein [Betaproteobacteria bacterium]NBP62589.1 DUF2256 domain-containing protein [Betaproteobacteria bacterium]
MQSFRGNKAKLPSKSCAVCGLAMTWRKHWAKNWDQVLYCSERCRKNKSIQADGSMPSNRSRNLPKPLA